MAKAPRLRTSSARLTTLDTRSAKPPPKERARFYASPDWKALVSFMRQARGYRCEICDRTNTRLFADHIVELADGGAALDPLNLQLTCGSCHTRKTAAARARRQRTSTGIA